MNILRRTGEIRQAGDHEALRALRHITQVQGMTAMADRAELQEIAFTGQYTQAIRPLKPCWT